MSSRSCARSSIGTSATSSSSEESAGCMCAPPTVFLGRCDLRFGFSTSLSVSCVKYSVVYWPRMYRAVIAMQCEHTLIIRNPLHVQHSLAGFSCGAGKSTACSEYNTKCIDWQTLISSFKHDLRLTCNSACNYKGCNYIVITCNYTTRFQITCNL